LSDPFYNNIYEEQRRDFFGRKLKNKFKRPRKNKVVIILMEYLINSIQNLEELNRFFNKPFIKENLLEKDKKVYVEKIQLKQSIIMDIDLKKIKEESYKVELMEKIKQEVIKKESLDIEKAISEKKKEYYAIPSIIDSGDVEEPVVIIEKDSFEKDEEEELMPWWRKLDLTSNPFPGHSLDNINEGLWDQIVYKTSIFKKYQKYIDVYPDELFKNIIFYGKFGSGKSTFFEYIQPSLIKNRIVPLYVLLYGESDAKSLQIKYEKKLLKELYKKCDKLNIYAHSSIPDNMHDTIDYLFDLIIKDGQRGLVIIIDELHKNPHLESALEFVNNLQSYTSELRKNNPFLNTGIFLAGSYDWKAFIEKTPVFSGSFVDSEDMPNVTPEIACEVINMRLKAFSKNPDNPKEIQMDAVKRAFNNLISSYTPITFRYFIKEIVDEFKRDNFEILTFDSLSREKRNLIRSVFEQNHIINTRFDILINGSKSIQKLESKENLKIILEQLVKLFLKRSIRDDDIRIKQYLFHYKRLSDVGLIVKSYDNMGTKWTVSQELLDLNEDIIKNFGISLENYLLDIYYYDELDEGARARINDLNYYDFLTELPTGISKNILNSLNNSIRIRNKLNDIYKDINKMNYLRDIDERINIRKEIVESIRAITRAVCLFEHISTSKMDELWNEYWFLTDSIVRYERFIKNYEYYNDSISDHINITELYQIYSNCYDDIFTFIINQLKFSKYWRLPVSELTKDEFLNFYNIRDLWREGRFSECLKNTSDLFENKLRIFIKNIFDIFYGNKYKSYLDETIVEEIKNKIKIESDSLLDNLSHLNFYDYINRNHLEKIMVDGKIGLKNWNEIFSKSFSRKNKEDMHNILDDLSNTNAYINMIEDEYITVEQKNYIKNYVINVVKYFQLMNNYYIRLLRCGNRFREKNTNKNYVVFRYTDMNNIALLSPIEINKETEIIFDILRSKKVVNNVPLDDIDYLESYFNNKYRNIYAMISLLSSINEKELKQFNIQGKIEINTNRYGGASVNIKFIESKLYDDKNVFEGYEKIMDEYAMLLEKKAEEYEFQLFFERNPNFINAKVVESFPKKSFGGELIPDFVIKQNDKKYMIVEIEKPNVKLFNKEGAPSHELVHAQQQIRDYMSWAIEEKEYLRKRGCKGISVNNVIGLLLIGDSSGFTQVEHTNLERINAEVITKYQIKTFDMLLNENKIIIKNLKYKK